MAYKRNMLHGIHFTSAITKTSYIVMIVIRQIVRITLWDIVFITKKYMYKKIYIKDKNTYILD